MNQSNSMQHSPTHFEETIGCWIWVSFEIPNTTRPGATALTTLINLLATPCEGPLRWKYGSTFSPANSTSFQGTIKALKHWNIKSIKHWNINSLKHWNHAGHVATKHALQWHGTHWLTDWWMTIRLGSLTVRHDDDGSDPGRHMMWLSHMQCMIERFQQ